MSEESCIEEDPVSCQMSNLSKIFNYCFPILPQRKLHLSSSTVLRKIEQIS